MKKTIIIALLFIAAGCSGDAISTEKKSDFTLELLFEKNGCKMYRFSDCGHYVYWSDCTGKTQYSYTTHHGKSHTTTRVEQITN